MVEYACLDKLKITHLRYINKLMVVHMGNFRTEFASDVTICGKNCSRFPLITENDDSVQMDVMRYLIHIFGNGASESSLVTYSAHLRDFYEQLSVNMLEVRHVSKEFLNGYKNAIELRSSSQYASQVLRTVLSYLDHLECRGFIQGVIGESNFVSITIGRTKKGGVSHSLSKGSASPKSNYFPLTDSVHVTKMFGPNCPRRRERFELMVEWGHVKGLRAKEICALKLSQIPDEESIRQALIDDRCLEVRLLVTKGSRPRNIDVHPILLARTLKWFEADRPAVVRMAMQRALRKGLVIEVSDNIFISEVTGKAITSKSLSNAVRNAYKRAVASGKLTKSQRVWLHGLRKLMINRELDSRPIKDAYRRENELRQETGHGTLDSLGRYVADK